MITEIRNKITTVGETVTGNFYYQVAPVNQAYPYCVYSFFGNELKTADTTSEFEDIYFQISCYQRTDGLVETLAGQIEAAFESADMDTTNYKCLQLRKLRRVPFPLEADDKSKRLIIEYYALMEQI